MKLVGIDETIDVISFFHKGLGLKYKYMLPPTPYSLNNDYFVKSIEAKLVFDDLREVDMLISMLERFKIECGNYFDNWHSEHYVESGDKNANQ